MCCGLGEEIPVASTGDDEADALTNTARFTAAIEEYVARIPTNGFGYTADGRRAQTAVARRM